MLTRPFPNPFSRRSPRRFRRTGANERTLALDARAVLENSAFREVFAEIQSNLLDDWLRSAPGETAQREELYRTSHALHRVHALLGTRLATLAMTDGQGHTAGNGREPGESGGI